MPIIPYLFFKAGSMLRILKKLYPHPDPMNPAPVLQISHHIARPTDTITIWAYDLIPTEITTVVAVFNSNVEAWPPGPSRIIYTSINQTEFTKEFLVSDILNLFPEELHATPPLQDHEVYPLNFRIEGRSIDGIVRSQSWPPKLLGVSNIGYALSPTIEAISQDPTNTVIKEVIEHITTITDELKDFSDDVRNSVIELTNAGVLFLGRVEQAGNFLIGRFGRVRKFETIQELQDNIKLVPSGSIIAVKNGVLPFGRSGQQIYIESTNPEPIILTIMGIVVSWKFIYAVLTFFGLYVFYQVFRQPEASIIEKTEDTITIETAGRVIVLNRHTGEIISDTGDPKTPIETITQDNKLLLIGGGAVGGFVLASLLRR